MKTERGWIAAVCAVCCLFGCAGTPPPDGDPGRVSPGTVEYLPAVVVDLGPDGETVTVKETVRFETWRVTASDDQVVRTSDGSRVGIEELRIGDRVEIRGTSRVPGLIHAYEIALMERPEDREEGIELLPGGGGTR